MATWAPARLHSPLGYDQLIPIALVANERISHPSDVYAVCRQGVVDPYARLNQPCCVTLQNAGSPVRCFRGIVQAIGAIARERGTTDLHAIRAELWTKPARSKP